MRVAVAGTRSFGSAVVDRVAGAEFVELVGVIAPVGDRCAQNGAERGLPLADRASPEVLRGFGGVDVLIAAHSHAFIGQRTRAACRIGALGYHPSLLPRHRGRDAVRWTVHMGDPVAGGSVYWLTDNVDAGPIAVQDWCWVLPGMTASELWRDQLFPMGLRLITLTLSMLNQGLYPAVEQDERVASWEPSWEREPLHRPELLELGSMPAVNGQRLRVVNSAGERGPE